MGDEENKALLENTIALYQQRLARTTDPEWRSRFRDLIDHLERIYRDLYSEPPPHGTRSLSDIFEELARLARG